MAGGRLTWQDVRAPEYDTRGLAQAGNGINAAFDRFGNMLQQREDTLRKGASDAQLANVALTGTPEEIAALRAKGFEGMDPRVDKVAYANAMALRENQLTELGLTREQLAVAEDPRKNAAFYAEVRDAYKLAELTGDRGPLAALTERAQALGARSFADFGGRGMDLGNEDQDQAATVKRDGVDANYKSRSLDNDAARLQIAREAAKGASVLQGMQIAALQRNEATRVGDLKAGRWGETYGGASDAGLSVEDVLTNMRGSKRYLGATGTERTAMESSAEAAFNRSVAATEDELSGKFAPGRDTGGMPGFMNPGAAPGTLRGASARQLAAGAQQAASGAAVGKAAITNTFLASRPTLDVQSRVDKMLASGKPVEFDQVVSAYKNSGVTMPEAEIRNLQATLNLSNEEMLALQGRFGFGKPGYLESIQKTGLKAFIPGAVAKQRAFGANTELRDTAKAYQVARDAGDGTRAKEELGGLTGEIDAIEANLAREIKRSVQQAGRNNGAVPAETATKIKLLEQDLARASARKK